MKITSHKLLFILIFILGTSIRAWRLGTVPAGLNQDEASHAVDAYNLYRFGVDHNGISYPVQFIMWGSGQSFLYEYLLIPFMVLGPSPLTTRLPIFILGILTLPLVYLAARQTAGSRFALIAMFLLAISPWHIMSSRWALEDNTLPFIFLIGYIFLLKSKRENHWFLWGCAFLGLCFYVYGAAYVAVPAFLLLAIPILLRSNRVSLENVFRGIIVLFILCIPIGLFIIVNTLKLETIYVGPFTIPRFPVEARYETLSLLYANNRLEVLADNLTVMLKILILQTDGLPWNSLQNYGYFYKVTFPLEIAGAVLLITWRRPQKTPGHFLVLAWLVAALAIGTQIEVNINRIGLIFIPLILCTAYFLEWLVERTKLIFILSICAFLAGFAFFTRDYFGADYQRQIGQEFFAGFLPAIDYARQAGNNPICVTDKVNMPYIYVLFSEKTDPTNYLATVKYLDPNSAFRNVRSFGRYTFGLKRCRMNNNTIYILMDTEPPPYPEINYEIRSFNDFKVYIP